MDGDLHYRVTGGRLSVRSAGDRQLFAEVFRWDRPIKLSTGTQEWFSRPPEPPVEPAVLALQHGGPVVGRVIQWRSSVLGLDAVLAVRESPGGDGLLELVDRHGSLPLSPAFRGTKTKHSTGTQWRKHSDKRIGRDPRGRAAVGRLRRWAP